MAGVLAKSLIVQLGNTAGVCVPDGCVGKYPVRLAPAAGLASNGAKIERPPGDTSGYQLADQVHPTPLGYQLIANHVLAQMQAAGWF